MQGGGYSPENHPYLAQKIQQLQALAPTPAKEHRTRATILGQLASLEQNCASVTKAHDTKIADIDTQIAKLQQARADMAQAHGAETKLWEAAREQINSVLKNATEADPLQDTSSGQVAPSAPDPNQLSQAFQSQIAA